MILPKVRDPRLVTIRRGGRLTDTDHRLIALWAATRAEHVLSLFERAVPDDPRPRQAIGAARAWVRGELPMMATRALGGHAMGAARPLAAQRGSLPTPPSKPPASPAEREKARRLECAWQRAQLTPQVRDLVIDDQQRHNDICWSVFDN